MTFKRNGFTLICTLYSEIHDLNKSRLVRIDGKHNIQMRSTCLMCALMKVASRVYVLHLKHHNSSMVIAIQKSIIQSDLQILIAERQVEMIHFITDTEP